METGHTLIYLIIIIAAAKIGGEIAEYFRQPAVLGELLVGILLSLTMLREAALDPAIIFVGSIGIVLLLFEVGLASDLDEFTKVGHSAALVAVIGVVLPLAMSFGAVYAFRGDYQEALFLGATITATSIGITTRVLMDMGKMATKEAQIILGAAVIDDILGLLLLSVVLQIASTGRADVIVVAKAVITALVFLVGAIWVGIRFAPKFIPFIQRLKTRGILVSLAFLFCLTLAYGAERLGLAEIIGAFAAGLVLATTEVRVKLQKQIKPVTDIFVPVFFVLVGLNVNLRSFNPLDPANRSAMIITGILLVLAIIGKLAAGMGVVSRGVNKFIVGVGMVPRGEVGLIFASIGLKTGIVPKDLYGGLVFVVFITTLITPFWLRRLFLRKTEPAN